MLRSLRNARLRKLLMLGTGITTTVLLIAQGFLTLGTFGERLRAIAEVNLSSVTALVITSGVALGFFHYFVREEQELDEIRTLDPEASRSGHVKAARESNLWYAEGHIGRWVRENVVPIFIEKSANGLQRHVIIISMINPDREDICKMHSERRRYQHARQDQRWDVERIQAEICATVIVAAITRATHQNVHFVLYLKEDSAPFRLDISDSVGFLTTDDALSPAIRMASSTRLYKSVLGHFQEYERLEPTARRLDVDAGAKAVLGLSPKKKPPVSVYEDIASAAGLQFAKLKEPQFCSLVRTCSKLL